VKHQPLILGVAAAVITIGIGVGTVLAVTSGDDNANGTSAPTTSHPRRSRSSSTSSSTRTSTTTKPGSTSKAAGSRTATPTTPAPTAPEPPDPPDPVDQYHPLPLPPGVGATISSCGWSPANGGQLQATGTLSNLTPEDDFWDVDVFWLVHNQTQDEDIEDQNDIYDVAVGQTIPWNLSISYPLSPPNLSCALEVS
jgi:hypothetical protein